MIPGVKSIAIDIFTRKHVEFAYLPLGCKQIAAGVDLKSIILQERSMYVLNSSSKRHDSEIYVIDLHTL